MHMLISVKRKTIKLTKMMNFGQAATTTKKINNWKKDQQINYYHSRIFSNGKVRKTQITITNGLTTLKGQRENHIRPVHLVKDASSVNRLLQLKKQQPCREHCLLWYDLLIKMLELQKRCNWTPEACRRSPTAAPALNTLSIRHIRKAWSYTNLCDL